jgi:thymidylate synthase (FAD)
MKIVQPEVYIENQDWSELLRKIETKGRVCYKSETKIDDQSAVFFIESLVKRGHMSVLEHSSISVKFIVDRGVSHEIVRHRLASYSQESTRYCNYRGKDMEFIDPFFFPEGSQRREEWENVCVVSETAYNEMVDKYGCSPQEARSVLPNSLKTELWMTANLREWLHFFSLRAAKPAHPQMRQVAIPLLIKLQELLPPIFKGMGYDNDFTIANYAEVFTGKGIENNV